MRYICITVTGAMTYYLFQCANWNGIVVWYLTAADLLSFCFFAFDKMRSLKQDAWRIPEAKLLLTCGFGGSFGALLAETFCRHKISKGSFQWKLYGIVLIQLFLFISYLFLRGDLTPDRISHLKSLF